MNSKIIQISNFITLSIFTLLTPVHAQTKACADCNVQKKSPISEIDPTERIIKTANQICDATSKTASINGQVVLDPADVDLVATEIANQLKKKEGKTESAEVIANQIRSNIVPISIQHDLPKSDEKKMGEFSITWGYHKGWISKSDVRFSHPDGRYDFVAKGITAVDRPGMDAALPKKNEPYKFDVPQYQVSVQYLFPKQTQIAGSRVGLKIQQIHSKYIPVPNEEDRFDVGQDVPVYGKYFDGIQLNGQPAKVGTYSTTYWEYTDGLNEITLGSFLQKGTEITRNVKVDGTLGINSGIVLPATYSVIDEDSRDHQFDISGIVASLDAGGRITLWNKIFVEATATASVVQITNGRMADGGRISQQFNHFKCGANIGYQMTIRPRKQPR